MSSQPRAENAALYKQYQQLATQEKGVHFTGRLATYKYYNMDQVVAQSLALFKKLYSPDLMTEDDERRRA